jgi:putative phosphoribosyl transferase
MNTDSPQAVRIAPLGLEGLLGVPDEARGLVVFAHGSGSGRLSPRNQHVARALRDKGLGTLLLDLLLPEEEGSREHVFDIEELAQRLAHASLFARSEPRCAGLPIGFFGASTGAGAALLAASRDAEHTHAVVSRGGRPDLAGPALREVRAPTLLIVGSLDREVLALNREAQAQISAPCELAIVAGATHLFEEPGTLDEVVRLACEWFTRHLVVR